MEVLEEMPGWPGIKLKIEPFVPALSTIKEETHALAVIPTSCPVIRTSATSQSTAL